MKVSKRVIWLRILPSFVALAIFGAVLAAWPLLAGSQDASNAPSFPHAQLIIQRTDGKTFPYEVDIASTLPQEMYGLMFRRSLPADHGMIFLHEPDQPVSMWMKNTYIPLDMLFVRRDGSIVKIITHAQPLDLTPLPSGEPVHGVIEINAGDVEKYGLKRGDKILFPGFGTQP